MSLFFQRKTERKNNSIGSLVQNVDFDMHFKGTQKKIYDTMSLKRTHTFPSVVDVNITQVYKNMLMQIENSFESFS